MPYSVVVKFVEVSCQSSLTVFKSLYKTTSLLPPEIRKYQQRIYHVETNKNKPKNAIKFTFLPVIRKKKWFAVKKAYESVVAVLFYMIKSLIYVIPINDISFWYMQDGSVTGSIFLQFVRLKCFPRFDVSLRP